jgi:hypothetical protein
MKTDIKKGDYLFRSSGDLTETKDRRYQPPHVRTPTLPEIALRIAEAKRKVDEIKRKIAEAKAAAARYQ